MNILVTPTPAALQNSTAMSSRPPPDSSPVPVEDPADLDDQVDAEDNSMHAQQSIKSVEADASTVVQSVTSSDPGLFTFVLPITAKSHHVSSL